MKSRENVITPLSNDDTRTPLSLRAAFSCLCAQRFGMTTRALGAALIDTSPIPARRCEMSNGVALRGVSEVTARSTNSCTRGGSTSLRCTMQRSSPRSPGMDQVTSAAVAADTTSCTGRGSFSGPISATRASISARRSTIGRSKSTFSANSDAASSSLQFRMSCSAATRAATVSSHRTMVSEGVSLIAKQSSVALTRERYRTSSLAVGQDDQSESGLGVPAHVQRIAGQTTRVFHDDAAVQVVMDEETKGVASQSTFHTPLG